MVHFVFSFFGESRYFLLPLPFLTFPAWLSSVSILDWSAPAGVGAEGEDEVEAAAAAGAGANLALWTRAEIWSNSFCNRGRSRTVGILSGCALIVICI